MRKALVLLTGQIMTDEQLLEKFVNRENVVFNSEDLGSEMEQLELCIALMAVIISDDHIGNPVGKFQDAINKALEQKKQ
jgi:hypothetical protein